LKIWDTKCQACLQTRRQIVESFKDWLHRPFSADMDAVHWFLFFGLLIAISILWGMALRTVANVTSL
jgi:hypothetical protein